MYLERDDDCGARMGDVEGKMIYMIVNPQHRSLDRVSIAQYTISLVLEAKHIEQAQGSGGSYFFWKVN